MTISGFERINFFFSNFRFLIMKRSHHKSRNGCDLCKKRRVKCDEQEPCCGTCQSRRTVCHYSRPKVDGRTRSAGTGTPNSTSKLLPRPGSSSSASTPISPDPAPTSSVATEVDFRSSRRRKELQLMQFWFTKTCYSFTLPLGELFNSYVVNMALEYEYLADSMFALTSLHIASEIVSDPTTVAHYVSQSLHYQNNSMAEFRTAMQNPTITNCDAIFISSILTMACAVVSPQLPTSNHDATTSSMESVMALYEFINGISSIVNMNRQWLQDGPCKVMFWQFRDFESKSAHDVEIPMKQLKNLNHSVNSSNDSLHAVYERAIFQLERCFTVDKRLAISWLASTGTEFASELQHRRPMSLAIIMYWGVVLDELDDLWWAKYAGKKLVEELSYGLLGFYGEEWDKATNWAKAAVSL